MIPAALLRPIFGVGALLALVASIFYFGYRKGAASVEAEVQAQRHRAEIAQAALQKAQAEKTVERVVEYVDRVTTVYEKGRTITKEVPVYVPAESNCALPPGFRVLHDAAAANVLPDPAAITDAASADAQTVATTVTENYTSCHAIAEQLRALQAWVTDQQKLAGATDDKPLD